MEVKMYSPHVFANLLEFETAKTRLEANEGALQPLGDVILEHHLENKVGVSLLHKHFNLREDEVLIRNFKDDTFEIRPESSVAHRALPYMWAFSRLRTGDDLSLYPVEFIGKNERTIEYRVIADSILENGAFLDEFSTRLVELGADDTFGLSLVPHGLFQIPAKHTLFETDDIPNRRLIITVEPVNEIRRTETTRTLFLFSREGVPSMEGIVCIVHCGAHCGVHCGVHCGIHCGVHCVIHI